MGFTPQQVGRMSMWQFMAAAEGFVKANSPDKAGKMTSDEKDDLWEWMQSKG